MTSKSVVKAINAIVESPFAIKPHRELKKALVELGRTKEADAIQRLIEKLNDKDRLDPN